MRAPEVARLVADARIDPRAGVILVRGLMQWDAGHHARAIARCRRLLARQAGQELGALLLRLAHLPDQVPVSRRGELEAFVRHLVGACARDMARQLVRQQELEAAVRARSAELEAANRNLAGLDQLRRNLLANVTHELRTPLSGILGYGEILEDELGERLEPEQLGFLRQILHEGYHLRDMINTMLDMNKLAAGSLDLDRQPVSLELLLRQACEQYTALASDRQLTLSCELPPELPYVNADPSRTYQVLGHLLSNAVKFTPPGGHIGVAVALQGQEVEVEVRDSGVGIAPEQLPLLFTSFYQADPSSTRQAGGLGLGLSFSRRLVELQGGRIWAESRVGQGSSFHVTLPVWGCGDLDHE